MLSKSFFPTLKEKSFCLAFPFAKGFFLQSRKKFLPKLKILWFGEKSNKKFSWVKSKNTYDIFQNFPKIFKTAQNLLISREIKTTYFKVRRPDEIFKKPDKWKKHSVLKIVLATFFGRNLVYVWFEICPSYLSRKKGTSETFLNLSLFISRPRSTASASKIRLQLWKTFPRFPFFYLGNFGKTQIRHGKILLQMWHGKKLKQNTISWNKEL